MDKFTSHTGVGVPLRRSNVDTDQIIPAEYLKRVTRTGFADGLFSAWRRNDPDFVLNDERYAGATILLAGPDFGTGSSREHVPRAMQAWGVRCIIASSFARIFYRNCINLGLLAVQSPEATARAHDDSWIRVDPVEGTRPSWLPKALPVI